MDMAILRYTFVVAKYSLAVSYPCSRHPSNLYILT